MMHLFILSACAGSAVFVTKNEIVNITFENHDKHLHERLHILSCICRSFMKDYTFLFSLQCHRHDFGIIEKSRYRGAVAYSTGDNHGVSSGFNRSFGIFGEKLKSRSKNTT